MIFNVTGGGAGISGAALNVTAPSGCTVTVSKDGKTKTKTAGADGLAVFKGLESGQWTLTITDGEQTAQKTVTITADYSTAITFFSATIHVTYPAGSSAHVEGPNFWASAPDTSGSWTCTVPAAGDYMVCADNSSTGQGTNTTVSITENGQSVSLELSYVYYMVKDGVLKASFSTSRNLSVTQNDGYVSFKGSASGGHVAYVEVDLTQYTTLVCTGTKTISSSVSSMYIIGVWGTSTSSPSYSNATASKTYSSGTNTTTLDVSSLSGAYLVGISTSSTNEQKITDFHLE